MTVLLWQPLISWSQCNPSTGEQSLTDTTTYPIPIGIIRQANIKLTKYEALKDIYIHQQDIISLYKKKDAQYNEIINTFQNRIETENRINQELSDAIEREKRKNHIYLGVGIGVTAAILIGLICK